jgi:phosphatidylserine decarboxylase
MRIDSAGWPFILGTAGFGFLAGMLGGWPWSIPGIVLSAICLFFFRDPDRRVPTQANLVLSPADGRVMVAGPPTGENVPEGSWLQISIFLSPLDVHVNRAPVGGRVTHREDHPGRFLPAYRHESGDLNEYTEIWLEDGALRVVVRQIVGLLARRVVCRVSPGDTVKAGERYGVMKFGSRMDVFLPTHARLLARPGDRVVAGETVLAELPPPESAASGLR